MLQSEEVGQRGTATRKASWEICMRFADWLHSIEIIDIECVLLSFLISKNFVSTKWRIYKGILASPRLLRREFRAVARSAIVVFFVKQSLQKDKNS